MDSEIFDVCIVGAGPGGASCAFHLAGLGKRVLLLEKKRFPRDKICGDAITPRAQAHLERMGVLQEILREGKGLYAQTGGLVSPQGIRAVSTSAKIGGSTAIAIKRAILDAKVARAAADAGACLIEDYPVGRVDLSATEKAWTIHPINGVHPPCRARVLVAADGASSGIARSLGLVKGRPNAVCSRSYVAAGTHRFQEDGFAYYPPELVPGYCSLFRQADGDLGFCCYIIPGGKARNADIKRLHHQILRDYPPVRDALGPRAGMEPMKVHPLRLGGVPRSYGDRVLVVGDAAGHIDPLTGEGIQYAFDAGEIAAEVIAEALDRNDCSAAFLRRYHDGWMKSFGTDFQWSKRMLGWFTRHPAFIDAFAVLNNRKGPDFMAKWAGIMMGSKPKRDFFQPTLALPLLAEFFRQRRT